MIMTEKGRLQIFRELIDTSDWFDADEVKPENGEQCLVKIEDSVGLVKYFSKEDKENPDWQDQMYSWKGPGFYEFYSMWDSYVFTAPNVKFWLPIKHE